jgi:hypothetical protein
VLLSAVLALLVIVAPALAPFVVGALVGFVVTA